MNNNDAASPSPPPLGSELQPGLNNQNTPPSHYYGNSQQQSQQSLHQETSQQHIQLMHMSNNITNLYNGLHHAESKIGENERKIQALETSNEEKERKIQALETSNEENERRIQNLEASNANMLNDIEILMRLCVDADVDIPARFSFDPSNINDEEKFTIDVEYFDKERASVNIYEVAKECEEFRRFNNIKIIGDLYKSIMKKVFGAKDIKHYTSSTNPTLKTISCTNVITVIKDLISTGYITNETNEIEKTFVKAFVNKSCDKCNTYLFSNPRRSDSKKKGGKRKASKSRSSSPKKLKTKNKKNRRRILESESD